MSASTNEVGKRILIVDDSRAIQAIIRRVLECEELGQLDFQTANDGAEALDKVQAFKPDLVLSDWHMPGVSGIELLQALRQTGHNDVAVGFVTTDRATECQAQARSNGALFVLNKPFDNQALRDAVALGLGRSTLNNASLGLGSSKPKPMPASTRSQTQAPDHPAIESLAQAQQALFAHLGMRGFDLIRADSRESFVQKSPQLIALYGSAGRKGVYAVGLLDFPACWMLGGLAAGCSQQEMQSTREAGKPSARQIEQATRFMRAMGPFLKKRSPSDEPSLNTARLSSQPLDRLASLTENNAGRTDLHLRIHALGVHGEARLSFMLAV
ncbi:response regulator [Roseateles sp.]|uniref:response regulator n=1 Tax=Roseateles sp. TaxID=1971397 RepID=UPI003BA62A4A